MSQKYLNESGLSYFWSKIKSALGGKQDSLISGTNVKTINGNSILGSGDLTVGGNPTAMTEAEVLAAVQNGWADKYNLVGSSIHAFYDSYDSETDTTGVQITKSEAGRTVYFVPAYGTSRFSSSPTVSITTITSTHILDGTAGFSVCSFVMPSSDITVTASNR